MSFDLTPEVLSARYAFLCRSTRPEPEQAAACCVDSSLDGLQKLLQNDLLSLARRGSPDDFADIYFALEQELERFREFCAFPALAQKFVVAFGGAFSAGKSSLINALLGMKDLLPVEIDPTTSLPTYLLRGNVDAICALNLFGHRIDLNEDEFRSLNHDEFNIYGSHIASLLRAAFITHTEFPWRNLAFADTPGYTKPDDAMGSARTDEKLARTQLNSAQAIVWVVSAENGGVTESDLAFLSQLNPDIPKLVIVSRADKKPEDDIGHIVQGIRSTLANRNIPALDIIPVSNRKKAQYPPDKIIDYLAVWNENTRQLRFAHNFKMQFVRYARFIEEEQRRIHLHLNRLNRILARMGSGDENIPDLDALKTSAMTNLTMFTQLLEALRELRQKYFRILKDVGDQVGIPLPEPTEIDLIDVERFDLLKLLVDLHPGKKSDYSATLRTLSAPQTLPDQARLLRRDAARFISILQGLAESKAISP